MKKLVIFVGFALIPASLSASVLQGLSAYDESGVSAGSSLPGSSETPEKPIDFCVKGRLLIFTGNCVLPKGSASGDSISLKACDGARALLIDGLSELYPQAQIYEFNNLEPKDVLSKFSYKVLGFFMIGEGNAEGGLITGQSRQPVYPSKNSCLASYDVFGGLFSHSKYSPDAPAPAKLRVRTLSRMQLVAGGAQEPSGSWPNLCGPKLSLVYPTRTFAGRMKDDVKKLIAELAERKRTQASKALESICGACDQYVQAGYPLGKLCPPNSDVCASKTITPGSEQLVMDNYCLLFHPDFIPPSR
jgi:hypothetical protein